MFIIVLSVMLKSQYFTLEKFQTIAHYTEKKNLATLFTIGIDQYGNIYPIQSQTQKTLRSSKLPWYTGLCNFCTWS